MLLSVVEVQPDRAVVGQESADPGKGLFELRVPGEVVKFVAVVLERLTGVEGRVEVGEFDTAEETLGIRLVAFECVEGLSCVTLNE